MYLSRFKVLDLTEEIEKKTEFHILTFRGFINAKTSIEKTFSIKILIRFIHQSSYIGCFYLGLKFQAFNKVIDSRALTLKELASTNTSTKKAF